MADAQVLISQAGASEHRAVVPVTIPYRFDIGQHAFALQPATSDTTSDGNDRFYQAVQY